MTTTKIRMWGLPIFLLLCVVTVGQIYVTEHRQTNQARALADQRHSLAGDVDTLRGQVTYCRHHPRAAYCQHPAAPPPRVRISQHPAQPVMVVGADGKTGAPGDQGPAGERGPGPSNEQTREAVNRYMALHPLSDGRDGKDGRNGSDGPPPACAASPGQCVGAAGPVGPAGPKGDSGDRGPTGAKGPAGSNGRDGTDGVGVASVQINSDCHLIVTYTSGRTQDAGQVACPIAPQTTSTP